MTVRQRATDRARGLVADLRTSHQRTLLVNNLLIVGRYCNRSRALSSNGHWIAVRTSYGMPKFKLTSTIGSSNHSRIRILSAYGAKLQTSIEVVDNLLMLSMTCAIYVDLLQVSGIYAQVTDA